MGRPSALRLEKGDAVEINGQALTVLEVSDAAIRAAYLSGDYILRINDGRNELLKRRRLDADREEIAQVPLHSLKIMKK